MLPLKPLKTQIFHFTAFFRIELLEPWFKFPTNHLPPRLLLGLKTKISAYFLAKSIKKKTAKNINITSLWRGATSRGGRN